MTITSNSQNHRRPQSVSELFPDKWLKAAHLYTKDGRPVTVTVTIAAVTIEDVRQMDNTDEEKAILAFEGKDKRLILNKTQARALATIFHSEFFEDWEGKPISLVPGKARNGKLTINIFPPESAPAAPPANVNTTTGEVQDSQQTQDDTQSAPKPAESAPGNELDQFFDAAKKPTETYGNTDEETKIRIGLKTQYDTLAARAIELGIQIPQVDGDTGIDELLHIVETTTAALDEILKKRRGHRTETDLRIFAEIDLLNEEAAAIGMSQLKISPRTAGPELERMRDRLQLAINTKRQAMQGIAALAGHHPAGK